MSDTTNWKKPSLFQALLPILVLIALLTANVIYFGDSATSGANQVALIVSAAVAVLVGLAINIPYKHMFDGVISSINSAMGAVLILLMIGALAGTWLISGIVPAMIYYGLQILNPTIFLVATVIVCAIVSVATGSSWSTVATVGIALLGIGKALGMHEGLVAGAIISGAYFGDKISPMSDTTNLAPAMAGTDLFTHIRYMLYTTIPSLTLTLILFLGIGFYIKSTGSGVNVQELSDAITGKFNINLWLFIVPLIVILAIIKKIPAIPALLLGTILAGIFAVIFQPQIINEIAGSNGSYFQQSYMAVINSIAVEVRVNTDNEIANGLLKAKGMFGMMSPIWLIISAMCFGGVMESAGLLKRITEPLIKKAQSTGSLVATTSASCIFVNVTASDQYLSIVVPGRMFAQTYKDRGLAPENLSRTLEDSGTVTSVLVPWNTCGATQAGVLGVSTFTYLPYCFFNIISPFMTIFFAYMNIKIRKLSDSVQS